MRPRAFRCATSLLAPLFVLLSATPSPATMPPRSGAIAPEIAAGFERGLFALPERPAGLSTSSSREEWFIPIIRVAFTDSAIVHSGPELEQRLFDTTGTVPAGSLADYYQWASGGRLKVRGEVVATVVLPHDRNYYAADSWGVNASGTPNNDYGLFRDAIYACDASVDFSRFDLDFDGYVDMLWLVHAGPGGENTTSRRDLWSLTSRATSSWNNGAAIECNDFIPGSITRKVRLDRFTILPELSAFHPGALSEIGVFCHEFGHTLGLPDLYDTSVFGGGANVGPGNWTLMSTGAYGADGQSPEWPAHMGAWCLTWLGWTPRLHPSEDTTIVLRPVGSGGSILDFWFQGEDSPEHFLIENRVRQKYDRNLPAEGLLVQQVDEAVMGPGISSNRVNAGPTPGVRVLEADGRFDLFTGANHGDPNDPFPGQQRRTRVDDYTTPSTRTFRGAPTNISLENITPSGQDVSVRVRVRAPGWQAPGDMDPSSPEPLLSFGPATRAAVGASGRASYVTSELRNGHASVLFREKPWLGSWRAAEVVDRGRGDATDPTLARLGREDAVVAWIEHESGVDRVCYRARTAGRWGTPAVLSATAERSLAPSIATDARGRVFLAWLEVVLGAARVRFVEFLWSAPYGQPTTVTVPVDQPSAPLVAAAGDGHAYLLWPDQGPGRQVLFGCRFHPDSGLSARFTIGPNTPYGQPTVSAALDTSGVLHVVWQQTPGASSEIHYQRRHPQLRFSLRDTTLDALGDGLQNPRIVLDPQGGMHVAYERAGQNGFEVRYKRWTPTLGWDHRATQVSDAADVTTSTVDLLPTSNGNVLVTWLGFDGSTQRLRERARTLDGPALADVPAVPRVSGLSLTLGPNPLRAGQPLELSGAPLHAGTTVELLDASGRRVATVTPSEDGRARITGGATAVLPAGLYFVRVRGTGVRGRVVVLH